MAASAYKSIVYKEVVEIDGVVSTLFSCDFTESINEKIDCGLMSHLDSEVIEYIAEGFIP